MDISYEYVARKLFQKRLKSQFMHKTKYGKALGEQFGYDEKAHREHYEKIKNNPDQLMTEFFKN